MDTEKVSSVVSISNLKPFVKNSLRAFFSVTLDTGMVIHNCTLYEKDGGRWIGLPSEKFTNQQGVIGYKRLIEFTDRAQLDVFRDLVLNELDRQLDKNTAPTPTPATAAAKPAQGASSRSRPSQTEQPPWLRDEGQRGRR